MTKTSGGGGGGEFAPHRSVGCEGAGWRLAQNIIFDMVSRMSVVAASRYKLRCCAVKNAARGRRQLASHFRPNFSDILPEAEDPNS
jgi:hypothetical protein